MYITPDEIYRQLRRAYSFSRPLTDQDIADNCARPDTYNNTSNARLFQPLAMLGLVYIVGAGNDLRYYTTHAGRLLLQAYHQLEDAMHTLEKFQNWVDNERPGPWFDEAVKKQNRYNLAPTNLEHPTDMR
jgi:hypothetical protein